MTNGTEVDEVLAIPVIEFVTDHDPAICRLDVQSCCFETDCPVRCRFQGDDLNQALLNRCVQAVGHAKTASFATCCGPKRRVQLRRRCPAPLGL